MASIDPLRTLRWSVEGLSLEDGRMSPGQKLPPTYLRGFALMGFSLLVGFLGAHYFDDFNSSSEALTWVFVLAVTAAGLFGAAMVGWTVWRRNNPFSKHRK